MIGKRESMERRRTTGSAFSPRRWRETVEARPWVLVCLLALVAAVLRLWDVGAWPAFIDEDIYTWEASRLVRLPLSQVVQSADWGKAPLPFLVQGNIGSLIGDHLVAGRLLAALSGLATTVLCFFLGLRLAGTATGLVTSFLYAVSPVAVLHERMALLDGPLVALSLGTVLAGWLAIERRSWLWSGFAWIPGILAVQCKVPGIATFAIAALVLVVFPGTARGRAKFACVVAVAPVASYLALMASPLAAGLADQNAQRFSWPSIGMLRDNLGTLLDSLGAYFPAGLWFFVIAGAVLLLRDSPRRSLLFFAAILVWSLPWLVISWFTPSRYYLPALPYAYAFAGAALARLPKISSLAGRPVRTIAIVLSALVLAASGAASVQMVVGHATATLSKLDDWQYRSGWPSGYGYAEAADFISGLAEPGSAVAYVVDAQHRAGVGFLRPLPQGVISLGLQSLETPLASKHSGTLYVVVDDGRSEKPGQRVSIVLARELRLSVVAYFPRPGSDTGVYILSTRAGL